MRSAKPRFAYTISLRTSVSASAARSRPSPIDGRWTSANGMETSTRSTPDDPSGAIGTGRSDTSGRADAGSLAISLMERPRLLESADGPRDRAVILVHPLVVLLHL